MSEQSSLSEKFSKLNHARHILMDVAMLSAAIGLVVSTGGFAGILDPLGIFAQMHIPSMADLSAIGTFIGDAFSNAANGVFMTDAMMMDPHSVHAMHAPLITGVDVDAGSSLLPAGTMDSLGWN